MVVLKLDFQKAFDSVSWEALKQILATRGFGDRWIRWVDDILASSSSRILINGTSGERILSKCGLRQGDALSPYLFILFADILQQLCQKECQEGNLVHPLGADGPFPILQYADDTLILLRGDVQQAGIIKRILEDFSNFTGLKINYHKSTFVPIGLDQHACQGIAEILNCQTAAFPCTYLGLPLSLNKIPHGLLMPVIQKVDKRLSGWLATFLSWGGGITLINAVLAAIPSYYMGCFLWPSQSLEKVD